MGLEEAETRGFQNTYSTGFASEYSDDETHGEEQGDDDAPSSRYPPNYTIPTHVEPKQPLQEYTHAEADAVKVAFTPVSHTGIRSLPDAMADDFKRRLYEQMVANHHAERESRRHGASTSEAAGARLSSSKSGSQPRLFSSRPLKVSLTGHKPITKLHPHSGAFSSIEYISSEYGREEVLNKFERLRSKCAQINPTDFVVQVPPQGPQGTPSFSVHESTREKWLPQWEMDMADQKAIKEGCLAGPFITGRRVDKLSLLRGRADECMVALCKLLSTDWPSAFLQVFEDISGGVVVSFDATRAIAEGDLSAYMQNFARNNSLVSEYHLKKDGSQWGVVDDETQSVFYLLWPPWVRHDRYKVESSVPVQSRVSSEQMDSP